MNVKSIIITTTALFFAVSCSNLPPENPGNIKAYPNPYQPTAGNLTIEKTDGTQFVTTDQQDLVVYDYNLLEVYRANPTANAGKIYWAGIDANGVKVAPGVYYIKLISTGQTTVSNADSMFRLLVQ